MFIFTIIAKPNNQPVLTIIFIYLAEGIAIRAVHDTAITAETVNKAIHWAFEYVFIH
jgi:hypothetical protein